MLRTELKHTDAQGDRVEQDVTVKIQKKGGKSVQNIEIETFQIRLLND